jgi:hypothetical protein
MYPPEVRSGFAQENFSQKFELVLEVKGETQLACISVAARSKGYTRPTWTSGSLLYQPWFCIILLSIGNKESSD